VATDHGWFEEVFSADNEVRLVLLTQDTRWVFPRAPGHARWAVVVGQGGFYGYGATLHEAVIDSKAARALEMAGPRPSNSRPCPCERDHT
jgi:hypothetical protein